MIKGGAKWASLGSEFQRSGVDTKKPLHLVPTNHASMIGGKRILPPRWSVVYESGGLGGDGLSNIQVLNQKERKKN